MFAVAVLLLAAGYALAFTGADKLTKKGAAPSLLYNLGISNDSSPGAMIGASYGGGATVQPATTTPNAQTTTPVAPAMPSPTFNANPLRAA